MRRKSIKKSSMFKVQQDKNVYKTYLEHIQSCATVRQHPELLESIKRTSHTIYNYCYDFAEQNPFNKGINYSCKNYGLCFPTSSIMVIREWIPNAKEVYLLGDFNKFNQTSHPMIRVEDQENMYKLELDIAEEHINDESRILLKIVDTQGNIHKMAPPSCKIRTKQFGYVCINIEIPATKQQKKQDIIMAYTIDLAKIFLGQVLKFIQTHQEILKKFNTIILRGLFDSQAVMDRGTLNLEQMKCLRDIVNKVKNQMGLKIILEWSLEPGALAYGENNPIEKELLRKEENGLWHYDLQKQDVIALYLANLSYLLSVFQVDGYHFKRIDSFCKDECGQVLVKCLNIMNSRLHENGFTLASSKKQVSGLNQPILEGGLGFTFTYNYNENFLDCKTHSQLKEKFDILEESSNCVAINLDELNQDHELNFLFAVLVSGKGIFCKGQLSSDNYILLSKLFLIRKQSELFDAPTAIINTQGSTIIAERGNTCIIFNFGWEESERKILDISQMELVNNFSRSQPIITQDRIKLAPRSCCIFQK